MLQSTEGLSLLPSIFDLVSGLFLCRLRLGDFILVTSLFCDLQNRTDGNKNENLHQDVVVVKCYVMQNVL